VQTNEELIRNQQALAAEIQAKEQEMQALRNEILETKAAQQKKEDEMQVLKAQMGTLLDIVEKKLNQVGLKI
jgi:hypothetical protein